MSGGWAGSDRRSRLPADWKDRCREVHRRSRWRCEFLVPLDPRRPWLGTRPCGKYADGGVDHIIRGDDHRYQNLRDTCHDHHSKKSSAEGNAARAAIKARGKRAPERHPGSIRRKSP